MLNRFLIAFLFLLFSGWAGAQGLVVNEVMSSNSGFLVDEDGDTSDWLELYNLSDTAIALAGYYISDSEGDHFKFALPDTTMSPGGYLLVFASGKNRARSGAEIHANFAISANGETVLLTRNGAIIHRLNVPPMDAGTSFGLTPDGGAEQQIFLAPTPGQPNSNQIQQAVYFSHGGGIYGQSFQLGLTTSLSTGQIRYTTDGSLPTGNSPLYTDPLRINASMTSQAQIAKKKVSPDKNTWPSDMDVVPKCVMIRAAVFDQAGKPVSKTFTNTYAVKSFGSNHYQLPVVSIIASHKSLFDHETGLFVPGAHWDADDPNRTGNYYQTGDAWEREINLEYLDPSGAGLNQRAGLRIHGGYTRHRPQKGMRLYARGEYGTSGFDYAFFSQKPIDSYSRLVLKPFSSSWTQAGIEDYICSRAAATLNLDVPASRPVVVYLNGEYWGIYFLQERIDERFVEDNYGIDHEQVDMAEGWWGPEIAEFRAFYHYMEEADLSTAEAYETVGRMMDIDNFIDFEIFQVFIANKDWPANNVRSWRQRNDDSLRRWIFQDGDAALADFGFDGWANALYTGEKTWPTSEGATLFLRKLMENEAFRHRFSGRLEYLLSHQLSTDSLATYYDEIAALLQYEAGRQIDRFSVQFDDFTWSEDMANLVEFLKRRPCVVARQYNDRFDAAISVPYECWVPAATLSEPSVYPNPNKGAFTVDFDAGMSGGGVAFIHDVRGHAVAAQPIVIYKGKNTVSVDLGLATGLYLVRIVANDLNLSARVMVE